MVDLCVAENGQKGVVDGRDGGSEVGGIVELYRDGGVGGRCVQAVRSVRPGKPKA